MFNGGDGQLKLVITKNIALTPKTFQDSLLSFGVNHVQKLY